MELRGVHVVVGAEGDAVGDGVDMGDVSGMTECDPESLALTDGVVDVTLMGAEDVAFGIDVLTGLNALVVIGYVGPQEGAVIIVGDEAYLLALTFDSEPLISVCAGDLADLVLGVIAEGEDRATQLVFGEPPEEIGLVLAGVCCGAEIEVSVSFGDPGVVTGGNEVAVHLVSEVEHLTPLDGRVTEDTGIGGTSRHVLVDEVLNDAASEGLAKVHDMVLKAHSFGVMLGFHDGVNSAAAFLFGDTGLFDGVIGTEGDADYFVALLEEDHRTHSRVDAS